MHRQSLKAAAWGAIALAGLLGLASQAMAFPPGGEVIMQHRGVPATFSGGDIDFTAKYDMQIVAVPDGSTLAIFNQRGSDDVLQGDVNASGLPPVLRNPGKEKLTGGRIENDRTLTYSYYEYISQGQKRMWSKVVFQLPAGSLPFPLAAAPEKESEEGTQAGAVTGPQEEGGEVPLWIPGLIVITLASGAVLYIRRPPAPDPAVAKVREAARRMTPAIQNNLKEIGLALHGHTERNDGSGDEHADTAADGGTAPAGNSGGAQVASGGGQVGQDPGYSYDDEFMGRCNSCGYAGVGSSFDFDSDFGHRCRQCGSEDTERMSDEDALEHIAKELGDKIGSGKSEAEGFSEEHEERPEQERQSPPQEPPRENIMDEIDTGPGPIA